MINLPKPSAILMKNYSEGKSEYLFSYLKTLVSAVENAIPAKLSDDKNSERNVADIKCVNGIIYVIFSNGEEKQIEL